MTHAIRFTTPGGPEVLSWEAVDLPEPGPGEVRLRHTAVGVNFIDVYHRTGAYPVPLPSGIGLEAAGVVEALGPGVTGLGVGDRVAYASPPIGAYAEARIMPASRVVPVPDGVSDQDAAALMLQGLTAHYLLHRTYSVSEGDTILVHAAAGGVGLLMCQWAKHLGATVIGTVGSDEKAALAVANGCDLPINYTRDDFAEKVREVTDGAGVPVVYDSIGKDTLMKSLDCLRPLGMLVSFGNASGPPEPIDLGELGKRGSLFMTRPSLMHYTAEEADLRAGAAALFEVVGSGHLSARVNHTYALKDAAAAHRDLEARKTTGSIVLEPEA